eukprot:GHVU01016733.1.p1 GENE.GHVU01016733.1~~GHVU01016733.1.p1  ORF type:complete len:495 (-),score=62.21 GHVU01016733.1:1819-3303(-)
MVIGGGVSARLATSTYISVRVCMCARSSLCVHVIRVCILFVHVNIHSTHAHACAVRVCGVNVGPTDRKKKSHKVASSAMSEFRASRDSLDKLKKWRNDREHRLTVAIDKEFKELRARLDSEQAALESCETSFEVKVKEAAHGFKKALEGEATDRKDTEERILELLEHTCTSVELYRNTSEEFDAARCESVDSHRSRTSHIVVQQTLNNGQHQEYTATTTTCYQGGGAAAVGAGRGGVGGGAACASGDDLIGKPVGGGGRRYRAEEVLSSSYSMRSVSSSSRGGRSEVSVSGETRTYLRGTGNLRSGESDVVPTTRVSRSTRRRPHHRRRRQEDPLHRHSGGGAERVSDLYHSETISVVSDDEGNTRKLAVSALTVGRTSSTQAGRKSGRNSLPRSFAPDNDDVLPEREAAEHYRSSYETSRGFGGGQTRGRPLQKKYEGARLAMSSYEAGIGSTTYGGGGAGAGSGQGRHSGAHLHRSQEDYVRRYKRSRGRRV